MNNNGVTLVALVITIIILLIIAGVAISFVIGDNGILTKATTVELEYSKAEVEEKFEKIVNDKLMESYAAIQNGNPDISSYYKESILIPEFIEKGYIFPDTDSPIVSDVLSEMTEPPLYSIYTVNVSAISDGDDIGAYGKGNLSEGDVFTLEVKTDETGKSTGEYELKYYETAESDGEVLTTVNLYQSNNS